MQSDFSLSKFIHEIEVLILSTSNDPWFHSADIDYFRPPKEAVVSREHMLMLSTLLQDRIENKILTAEIHNGKLEKLKALIANYNPVVDSMKELSEYCYILMVTVDRRDEISIEIQKLVTQAMKQNKENEKYLEQLVAFNDEKVYADLYTSLEANVETVARALALMPESEHLEDLIRKTRVKLEQCEIKLFLHQYL